MERLKYLGTWVVIIILFYIFSSAIIYIYLHGDVIGEKIYNMTHQNEVVVQSKIKS